MSEWNPTTLQHFINAIGNQLKPVKGIFDIEDDNEKSLYTEQLYTNYKKFFEFLTKTYGIITIPVGTLLFHSNQYFCHDILDFEPIGQSMKIQDLKQYKNKNKTNFSKFSMTEYSPRVYCNFTPAANFFVEANFNISEAGYVTTKELYFFQLPAIGDKHLKDIFGLTSTLLFKQYIQEKNEELGKIFSGFILSTVVDVAPLLDRNTTYIDHIGYKYAYPEVLILDGFQHLKKFMQYDLYKSVEGLPYNLSASKKGELSYISYLIDTVGEEMIKELGIPRIDLGLLLTEIIKYSTPTDIGVYGSRKLKVYIKNKDIPPIIREVYEENVL